MLKLCPLGRTVQASTLALLGLAACSRLPHPAREIADQLTAFPVTVQPGDSTTRVVLRPVRSSLRITPAPGDSGVITVTIAGRWAAADEGRLMALTPEDLRPALLRAGIQPLSLRQIDGKIELSGTIQGRSDGERWRMARDILPWTPNPAASIVPLALNRWRRHVVDENRPGKAVFVIPADIDHDGRPEILAGAFAYHRTGIALDRWSRTRLGGDLGNVALAADLDRDGYLDLIGTKSDADYPVDSTLVWLRGSTAGALLPGSTIPPGHGDFLQGIALVGSSEHGAQIAFSWHKGRNGIQLLSLTNGQPDSLGVISTYSQDEQLTAADIDGDGRTDLVTGTRWLRRSDSAWSLGTIDTTTASPDRNRVADINGDGKPDVVTGFEAISVPGWVCWYQQAGNGWIRHDVAELVGPMSLDLGDLDADGDIDIVVGEHNLKQPTSARLLILENLGGGAAWRQIEIARGDEHHDGAQLVDIDGDGDPDVISVGWGHSKVLLYENLAIP